MEGNHFKSKIIWGLFLPQLTDIHPLLWTEVSPILYPELDIIIHPYNNATVT